MKTLRKFLQASGFCMALGMSTGQVYSQNYTILHTFGTNVMGHYPRASLVAGPDGMLYGTAAQGGSANRGQLFKVNPDGTSYTALKDFTGGDGAYPEAGLVLSGVTLYGTAVSGGANDSGTVFKINTDGTAFEVLKEFSESTDGVNPYGKLVLGGGTLYGTTEGGGEFGEGTVFTVGVDGTHFTVLKHFTGDDGRLPHGTLVLSGATLYGTTVEGGDSWNGTVFKVNTDGSGFTVLREFSNGDTDGAQIFGGLMLAEGTLYGSTSSGGTFGHGTLFKLNTDGTGFAVLKNFNSAEANEQKSALVMLGTTLYGLSSHGGSNDWGAIFKINPDGSDFAVLREFGEGDGIKPYGGLLVSGTTLYATTSEGGRHGYGTVFKIESDGSGFTVLTNFMGGDGTSPDGLAISGMNLYGTTGGGGASGRGTLFTINSDGVGYAVLKDLTNSVDGQNPNGRPLVSGTNVYGTAAYGGSSGMGSIFALRTDGSGYTLLKEFTDSTDGTTPKGSLVRSGDTLYGVAGEGGISNYGAVFQINTDGSSFTVLKHFIGADGRSPSAGLVLSGTTLYGATYFGGSNNLGTIFKINTDGSGFAVLKEFARAGVDGANPTSLVLDGAALYGAAGAFFKINTDGTAYTVLKRFFGDDDGSAPRGLVLSDSILYGVGGGGIFGGGTVYQINTDGSGFAVIKHFGGDAGFGEGEPSDLALLGTTLYGTAVYGGNTGGGVLFSLSPGLPVIVIQPEPRLFFPVGGDTDFQVKATGLPAPSYQWYFNGTNALAGATNSRLMLTNVGFEQSGDYTVVVSNSFGSVTSLVARMDVVVLPPYIITQPTDWVTNLGAMVQFEVLASGTAPLAYQWLKDDLPLADSGNISGAQTPRLTLSNVFGGSADGYSVVVSNMSGSVTSSVATLSVIDPLIVRQPASTNLSLGQSAALSVLVNGSHPIAYQWRKNGAYLPDATGDNCAIPIVRASSAGFYDVVVSNQYSSVTSALAAVTVNLGVADPFDPGAGWVLCLALQPDGKILVGGFIMELAHHPQRFLGRLNPDGTLDVNFHPVLDERVMAVALQSDGKIVISGWFTHIDGHLRNHLARLNADGSLDQYFNATVTGTVNAICIQPNNQILIGGEFTAINGEDHYNIGRLNSDGSIDAGFNASSDKVNCLVLQPDGKILVGGLIAWVNGQERRLVARLQPNGSLDDTFQIAAAPGQYGVVTALSLQPDGRVILGGLFAFPTSPAYSSLVRVFTNGIFDPTFDAKLNNEPTCLVVQPDGKILVGGFFTSLDGHPISHLGRLNPDGSLDLGFDPAPDDYLTGILFQPNGKLLVGGGFTRIGGQARAGVARLDFYAPPQPVVRPGMQTAEIGFPASFTIRDPGFPQPQYQWLHEGVALDGATNRSFQVTTSGVGGAGHYQVSASNSVDIATSPPAVLNLIDPVERRTVPGLILTGTLGGVLSLESTTALDGGAVWSPLATVTLVSPPDWWFDLTEPLPTQCFYRAMVISGGRVPPVLELNRIPALTLTGNAGDQIQVDGINRFGPTAAWFTLDTVTLTNTSQRYFDVTAPGQPARLYRLVPLP